MSKDTDQFLRDARKRFDESQTAEQDNRTDALDDQQFENGEQWTEADKQARAGRPCPVINKAAGSVKQILGDARQNRPKIKVRPCDSQADPKTAELLSGLIRNIENISDAEAAYDYGHECAVRGGYGFWRVLTDYSSDDAFDQDILIKRIVNPFSVYFDPNCEETDFSDAQYAFICETLTKEEFKAKYPSAEPVDWEGGEESQADQWISGDKIRVAEYWYKKPTKKHIFALSDGKTIEVKNPRIITQPAVPEQATIDPMSGQQVMTPAQPEQTFVLGDEMEQPQPFTRTREVKCDKVMWCKMSGSQIIEGPQEWAGKYIPIIPCLGEEIWIEGKRILRSAIRHAKDPQRIYNWTRANAIEIMALGAKQPWIGTERMFEGHEQQWDQSHIRPSNRLLVNPDPSVPGALPQRQPLDVSTVGIHQESMLAADDIKSTVGIFDASLGAQGNETSGRAIVARQRQGSTATFVFNDNQVRAVKYTGRILVDLIPKIYDTERVVRLMNDDGTEAWQKINVIDQVTGQVIANDLSVGKYDVVIDAGPGYATKRMEAADGMIQLASAGGGQFMPILLPEIAKNLDWPGAQELGEKLQQAMQPPPPPPNPMAELEMQGKAIENQGKQVDIKKTQHDIAMDVIRMMNPAQPQQRANLTGK